MHLYINNVLLKSFFVFLILIKIGNVISKINDTSQLDYKKNSSLDSLNVLLINNEIKNQFKKEIFFLKNETEKNSKLIKTDKKNVSENNNQNHKEITEKTIKINLALNTDMKFKNNSDRQFPIVKNTHKKKSINVSLMLNSNFTKKNIFKNVSSSPFPILSLTPSSANLSKTVSVSSIKNFNKTSYQQILNNEKEFNNFNITKPNNSIILHSEKVLVYPVQVIPSNEQSQSKRAPHYLEEKFRIQPEKISTTTTPLPIRPSLIIDTQPLIEEVDSELNIKELNERLMSEEELIHQGTNVAGISNEESSFEMPLNTNHHLSQNDLEKIDKDWLEKNCLKNCTCSYAKKWPGISYQYRNTLNCSNNDFSSFPIINSNLTKFTERLIMSKNNLQSLLVDEQSLNCERLIELDLSNNQLKNFVDISNMFKNFQHPIVEFHPFHHHFPKEENNKNLNSKNSTKLNSGLKNMKNENLTLIKHDNANNNATSINNNNATRPQNKKNFIHKQHFFSICHRLKILDLSKNNFDVLITGSFRGLKKLRKLFLDECQIKFIEKNAFLGANDLRLLSLRFNSLSSVHSDMFQHMINLKVLDLTGNSLTYLGAGIFNSLVALQALHLGQNKLRQLSFQCFSGLDGLQLLTLNSNSLNTIPRFALQPLKKLKILDMSVNPIKQILEDDFSHSFVQLLLLNNLNELQHVARFAFWDLPYLNELQISHCINFIHLDEQAIVGAPALRRLRLEKNAIERLDDRLLENLARMTLTSRHQLKVYLAGNPFVCDCFFKPVYLCALDQTKCKIKIPDNENITCSIDINSDSKKNLTEYKIDQLKANQLPNECVPSFVPIITPINITIIRRLRSKFFLSCKAQGSPTPNVFWLQPNGEIHKEKLMTRHGHDLMESDLLTLPHAFRNDESHSKDQYSFIEHKENLSQLGNINQATSGNGISVTNSISSAHHGSSTLRVGHLTPNDAGLYTCVAENRLGSIKSHIQLITQQLKVYLTAENISINFITINWQVDSIFNPPLNETFKNLSNESYFKQKNLDLIKELETTKNDKNSNFLDYQLFYKIDSLVTNEDKQQINSETLGLEKIYDTNKFFASYESVLLNRKLKNFTINGLRSGTRYKVCIAVKEPKNNDLKIHNDEFFKKRSIYQERRIFRSKRNLISIESANYLAIGCLHAQTSHAAFYARNILRVEEFRFPNLISKTLKTTIKLSSLSMLFILFLVLIVSIYNWTKQKQRRSAYETPRKTLLSLSNNLQHQNSNNNTPFNTPLNHISTSNPSLQMKNIYSPLMMARCNQ